MSRGSVQQSAYKEEATLETLNSMPRKSVETWRSDNNRKISSYIDKGYNTNRYFCREIYTTLVVFATNLTCGCSHSRFIAINLHIAPTLASSASQTCTAHHFGKFGCKALKLVAIQTGHRQMETHPSPTWCTCLPEGSHRLRRAQVENITMEDDILFEKS